MADRGIANELNSSINNQVRDLRRQLNQISKTLADNGIDFDELAGEADHFMKGARKNARRASKQFLREADVLTHAAQKAPAATSTALVAAAVVGFGLALLVHLARED